MAPLPSSLALTGIPDGALIVAADHRTNYTAIQTAVNALITALSGGAAGQELQALSSSSVGYASTPKITSSTMAAGPPGSPADGDIWLATAVDANGTVWQFRYNAGSASAFKWEFIGGAPAYAKVDTEESVNNAAYAALATPGPSITVARQGDYQIEAGAYCIPGPATLHTGFMSYDVGATAAIDADAFRTRLLDSTANRGAQSSGSALRLKTAVAAGAAIVAKYKSTATDTDTYGNRWMRIVPVRVI